MLPNCPYSFIHRNFLPLEALAVFITSRLKESPPRYIRGICELFSALYPNESLQTRLKKCTSEHGKAALEIMQRGATN